MYVTPGVRFGLTSGHEKTAFVNAARARDREVTQMSSLGSGVARQEGRRLGTQHPPLGCAVLSATEDCVTRYRRRVTDLVTKTVNYGRCNFVLFHGVVVWDRIPSSRLRFSLTSFATPPSPPPSPPPLPPWPPPSSPPLSPPTPVSSPGN